MRSLVRKENIPVLLYETLLLLVSPLSEEIVVGW